MANIGIFYGSSTGNTEAAANKIAKALAGNDVQLFDVSNAVADFAAFDVLLFGTSTWGLGDLQDDWDSFVGEVKGADLSGKKVALFGMGDSSSYSDTFCDGISKIYEAVQGTGATIIGRTSTEGYSFDSSESVIDGEFAGLPLDEDNESDLTDQRIALWVEQLKKEF